MKINHDFESSNLDKKQGQIKNYNVQLALVSPTTEI